VGDRGPGIVLIGLRRAGKTTVGRALSALLRWPFVDLDQEIRRSEGLIPAEILSLRGEGAFREVEATVLADLAARWAGRPLVLATGGGTPLSAENRMRLRSLGRLVHLAAGVSVLRRRAEADPDPSTRPPLRSGSALGEIEPLHSERDPLYRSIADRIEPADGDVAAIAEALARWIQGPG
jgi:shikimate kinase